MSDTFATMIVPAALAPLARALAAGVSPVGGAGMFTAGLSPTGQAPATHYCSTGVIDERFQPLLTNAALLHQACQAAGAQVTQAQCDALVSQSDVSQEPPFEAFARLGLQLVIEGLE